MFPMSSLTSLSLSDLCFGENSVTIWYLFYELLLNVYHQYHVGHIGTDYYIIFATHGLFDDNCSKVIKKNTEGLPLIN